MLTLAILKYVKCALVVLVEQFCHGCHLEITSPVSASDLISHMQLCIEDTLYLWCGSALFTFALLIIIM